MSSSPSERISLAAKVAAANLRVDAATAEALRALQAARVESLLLKGPTFARWLYGPEDARGYGDCDLLVRPESLPQAQRVLEQLGYEPAVDEDAMPSWWREHGVEWLRPGDGAGVDLHRTLAGVGVDNETLWGTLSAHTETFVVGGVEAHALDAPARTFHVALHAAQHGPHGGKGRHDLDRALATLDAPVWVEASAIARELEATAAFAAGLRLTPAGGAVADELGLPSRVPADVALRATSAPPVALGFDQLARAHGLRERLEILRYKVFPPPTFMRAWSPRARQGRLGLAIAYISRPLWLLRGAPAGFRAWRAARRQ